MSGRFGHSGHVLRFAALFVVGFIAFVVIRASMIPKDFGVLGFYRAGALDDATSRDRIEFRHCPPLRLSPFYFVMNGAIAAKVSYCDHWSNGVRCVGSLAAS